MGDLAQRFVEQLIKRFGSGSTEIELSRTQWLAILEAGQGADSPERAIGRIVALAYEAVNPDLGSDTSAVLPGSHDRPPALAGEYLPPGQDRPAQSLASLDALIDEARSDRLVTPRRPAPAPRAAPQRDRSGAGTPAPATAPDPLAPTRSPVPPLGFTPVPSTGTVEQAPTGSLDSSEPATTLPAFDDEASTKKRRVRSRSPFSPKLAEPSAEAPALGTTGPPTRAQWRTRSLFVPVVPPEAPTRSAHQPVETTDLTRVVPVVAPPSSDPIEDLVRAPQPPETDRLLAPVPLDPYGRSEPAGSGTETDAPRPEETSERRRLRMSRTAQATAFTWVRNVGVIILAFVAWQLWGTAIAQHHAQQELASSFNKLIHSSQAAAATKAGGPSLIPATSHVPVAPEGTVVAQISIPSIGVSQFVVSGTNTADLAKGPGHYIGTAAPGQAGNVAIAGHRTTHGAPFNRLAQLAIGDTIVLTNTLDQHFTYTVSQPPFAVSPTDVGVLNDFGDNRITLTTCNPEFSAAQRLIVVGRYVPSQSAALHPAKAPNAKHAYALVNSQTASWNWILLPVVLFEIAVLVVFGLWNRRLSTYFGRSMSWVMLGPIWVAGLIILFQTLTTFLPASV